MPEQAWPTGDWVPICDVIGQVPCEGPGGGRDCFWTFEHESRHWYIEVSPEGVAYTFTPEP
jgi:hypothetical protein